MAAPPEELFRLVVGRVLNSWSALQLAVEHGMGGRNGYAKANGMIDTLVEFFKNKPEADWCDVADLLGDFMDDEFNTICEDDSAEEVGTLLWEFHQQCYAGEIGLVEQELAKLPAGNWLKSQSSAAQDDSDDSDDDDDVPSGPGGPSGPSGPIRPSTSNGQNRMDAEMDTQEEDPDPGWTQVRRKR